MPISRHMRSLLDAQRTARLGAAALPVATEHDLQVQIADYLALALAGLPAWWSGIDHANARSRAFAARRKARGVKPGIPDFLVFWQPAPGAPPLIFGLEVKTPEDGVQSPAQRDVQRRWLALCAHYDLVRSAEDVCRALLGHGLPLRVILPGCAR